MKEFHFALDPEYVLWQERIEGWQLAVETTAVHSLYVNRSPLPAPRRRLCLLAQKGRSKRAAFLMLACLLVVGHDPAPDALCSPDPGPHTLKLNNLAVWTRSNSRAGRSAGPIDFKAARDRPMNPLLPSNTSMGPVRPPHSEEGGVGSSEGGIRVGKALPVGKGRRSGHPKSVEGRAAHRQSVRGPLWVQAQSF